MDRESVERLRFDRRLRLRLNWLDAAKESEYLEALPDVTDKMTTIAAEESIVEATAQEPDRPISAPQPVTSPAPVAGDFSTPSVFGSGNINPGVAGDFGRDSEQS